MADKVIVTKNKLDDLADSISTKAGVATPMTLSEMKTAVDNIQTGGGSGGTDTSDATLTSGSQMLSGVTAYSKGTKYTGTIATKTASDVTVSGGAVTTPTGYYATAVTKSVGTGSAAAPASITDTNPTLTTNGNTLTLNKTVSVTPVVTAGYVTEGTATNVDVSLTKSMPVVGAQLFTPGTSTRTVIPSMTYCSGPQSIEGDANLVPENIVSGKSIFGVAGTASGGSGGSVRMGVLRSDAELVDKWTMDQYVVSDLGLTIPAYSTTNANIRTGQNLEVYVGTPTTYRYFVTMRTLTIPVYNIATLGKGREDYAVSYGFYEWLYNPSGQMTTLDGTKSYGVYSQIVGGGYGRELYWSSATALSIYTSISYCARQDLVAPTIGSNKNLTIKTPVIAIRGNASYLTQTYFDAVEDIRCQYVIELWRVPLTGVDGWSVGTQMDSVFTNIANGGTLT